MITIDELKFKLGGLENCGKTTCAMPFPLKRAKSAWQSWNTR